MTESTEPFTVIEVAAQLRVHRNTVLRHLNNGDFPGAFRLNNRGVWRIPQASINAFIDHGTPGHDG